MAVEGLDTRKELSVVTQGDEDLGVGADGGFEDGERPGREFVFLVGVGRGVSGVGKRLRGGGREGGGYLELGDFVFGQLWGVG